MKLSIFIGFFLLVISCSKDECDVDPNCDADELAWIPYLNNQMLIFQNDSAERDTVMIERKSFFTTLQSGDECTEFETVYAKFPVQNNFIMIETRHEIHYPKYKAEPNVQTDGFINWLYNYLDTTTLTIDNKVYQNLRLIDNFQSGLSNIYYSKSEGIVSYQADSVKWYLVK